LNVEVGAGGGVLDVVSVEADYDRLPVTQDNLRRERLNPARLGGDLYRAGLVNPALETRIRRLLGKVRCL
jgi:hypothetical protein